MVLTYRLPEEMRRELAKPIGRLFKAADLRKREFFGVVRSAKTVVSVGDRVTETLAEMGRVPDVQIVDGRENRKERDPPDVAHVTTIRVKNPPGTITEEALEAVREAFKSPKPARVLAVGEEDLLAIPAIIMAPTSAAVFYGQPGEGIVMVRVTCVSRARNKGILSRMRVAGVQ